jgi:hypothetical protein
MEEKISLDLQAEMRKKPGPYKVSIFPVSKKLERLISVNRYEGIDSVKMKLICEETRSVLAPICTRLDSYDLISKKNYVADRTLRKVSALLDKKQIEDLSLQDYVKRLDINIQKDLPF